MPQPSLANGDTKIELDVPGGRVSLPLREVLVQFEMMDAASGAPPDNLTIQLGSSGFVKFSREIVSGFGKGDTTPTWSLPTPKLRSATDLHVSAYGIRPAGSDEWKRIVGGPAKDQLEAFHRRNAKSGIPALCVRGDHVAKAFGRSSVAQSLITGLGECVVVFLQSPEGRQGSSAKLQKVEHPDVPVLLYFRKWDAPDQQNPVRVTKPTHPEASLHEVKVGVVIDPRGNTELWGDEGEGVLFGPGWKVSSGDVPMENRETLARIHDRAVGLQAPTVFAPTECDGVTCTFIYGQKGDSYQPPLPKLAVDEQELLNRILFPPPPTDSLF